MRNWFAVAALFLYTPVLRAQPNPERFRLLAVTERALVYVDTATPVRAKHRVTVVVRFYHDSVLRPIRSLAAPVVGDMVAVVDCRGGTVRDSGATFYDAAGASITLEPPSSWTAEQQSTWTSWWARGLDGKEQTDGVRMYGRVCALFAPEYARDYLPPTRKRRR